MTSLSTIDILLMLAIVNMVCFFALFFREGRVARIVAGYSVAVMVANLAQVWYAVLI